MNWIREHKYVLMAVFIAAALIFAAVKIVSMQPKDDTVPDEYRNANLTGSGAGENSGEQQEAGETEATEETVVLCAGFAEYDWTRNIAKGVKGIRVELLNDTGTDLHSYQPTVGDLARIADCDLFIYSGGLSSQWIDEALSNAGDSSRTILSLMDFFESGSIYYEEYEDRDDEHLWTSLRLSEEFCNEIARYLTEAFPKGERAFKENCRIYVNQIHQLIDRYSEEIRKSGVPVVIADRMPFYYLFSDMGLSWFAAFDGCSAETEASFETVIGLADALNENELNCVLVIENSSSDIAQAVIDAAERECEVLTMNSMQSVTKEDLADGISFLTVMEENLNTLLKATGK